MTERRVSFRGRTLKGGFIVLSDKAPKLECTVRNFTKAGAALRVSTTFGLPQHFDVVIDGHGAPLPFAMANRQQDRRRL